MIEYVVMPFDEEIVDTGLTYVDENGFTDTIWASIAKPAAVFHKPFIQGNGMQAFPQCLEEESEMFGVMPTKRMMLVPRQWAERRGATPHWECYGYNDPDVETPEANPRLRITRDRWGKVLKYEVDEKEPTVQVFIDRTATRSNE